MQPCFVLGVSRAKHGCSSGCGGETLDHPVGAATDSGFTFSSLVTLILKYGTASVIALVWMDLMPRPLEFEYGKAAAASLLSSFGGWCSRWEEGETAAWTACCAPSLNVCVCVCAWCSLLCLLGRQTAGQTGLREQWAV